VSPSPDPIRAARLHASSRWLGATLLPLGLAALGVHAWGRWEGNPSARLMLGVFATLVSLGAFGTHDDSFLAAARDARARGFVLPSDSAAELSREEARRPARVREAKPHPRAAWVVLFLAVGGVSWAWFRAGQLLGWWT
jgi:hypothetical protein